MRIMLASSLLLLTFASHLMGAEVLREISWGELKRAGKLAAGDVVPAADTGAPSEALKVENRENQPKAVQLFVLATPGIKSICYAVRGSVRYENVSSGSYLEMWSLFPDGGACFSRTLDPSGPMGSLSGSADWRPFALPFLSTEKAGPPDRLEVNVVFTGPGTVYLGPPQLVQYDAAEDPFAMPGAWWGEQSAGLVGGIAGSVFGCIGAAIGTLAGLGKARRLVFLLAGASLILGIASLIAGIVAVAVGQPYAVYYPLLLLGVIVTAVIGANLPGLRRRYEQIELRKMAAMDLGGPGQSRPAGSS